eukprot:364790-Chlamydomonas_euryale.AAC.3
MQAKQAQPRRSVRPRPSPPMCASSGVLAHKPHVQSAARTLGLFDAATPLPLCRAHRAPSGSLMQPPHSQSAVPIAHPRASWCSSPTPTPP